MKTLEFKSKDVFVKVHVPLLVTYFDSKKKQELLVYASIIDIDSRVQAVFAQFHHLRSKDSTMFWVKHAPAIGEKNYDNTEFAIRSSGFYKHMSQREDDTFVSGVVADIKTITRTDNELFLFAWDGFVHQKLSWALEQYYSTPILADWIPYIFEKLAQNNHLQKLTIHDGTGDFPEFVAYHLEITDEELDALVSQGVKAGSLQLRETQQVQGE